MLLRIVMCTLCFASAMLPIGAQNVDSIITPDLIRQYVQYLAADSLKGRGNYTKELNKAAHFIAREFKEAGLANISAFPCYFQPFTSKKVPTKELMPDSSGEYNPQYNLLNVIGALPGRSRANEVIIFCAHYDHMGTSPSLSGDNIYNGANDNASGTAAVLALAKYYGACRNNERSIIFCAFAGEELGLLGSGMFVPRIKPEAVKAVINIEMIGQTGAAGKKAFFITGAYYSNLQAIFKKNLQGTGIKIRNEPTEAKQLFQRSDNFPFAKKGIPAHSIMCSDDDDLCYHQPCDEAGRINIDNMTAIINAIIKGSETIINGDDTPGRIDIKKLH